MTNDFKNEFTESDVDELRLPYEKLFSVFLIRF